MTKEVYLTILFDYYEVLLQDIDKEYFSDYYFSNLSLSEISENRAVSRTAVHKRIKKIEEELLDYESKLKLYDKEQKILDVLSDEKIKSKIKDILNN